MERGKTPLSTLTFNPKKKTQWLIIYQQKYPTVVQSTQNSHHHEVM